MRRIRRRLEKAIRLNRNNSLSHRKLPLTLETLESRLLLSTDLPGLHLIDPQVDYFDGQIVYLDFDGEQDVTYNGPVTVEGISVPAFSVASAELAGQEEAIIADVTDSLNQLFADSGVVFTAEKPEGDTPYSTVFIGGDDSAFSEYGSFMGLAEQIDVGNSNLTDKAFVFSTVLLSGNENPTFAASLLSEYVAHEVGHLLGYMHDEAGQTNGPLADVAAESGYIVYASPDTFVGGQAKTVTVRVRNTGSSDDMIIEYDSKPSGWSISPSYRNPYMYSGDYYNATFTVTPPTSGGSGTIIWEFLDDDVWSNDLLDTEYQSVSATPAPKVTSLSWRSGTSSGSGIATSREAGSTVYVRADAVGMNGQTITVGIWEDDSPLSDDFVTNKQITIGSSGYGTTSWRTDWQDDQYGGPEFEIKYSNLKSGLLNVTDTTPPSSFSLQSPDDNATITTSDVDFNWGDSSDSTYGSGFDKYELWVDDNSSFSSPIKKTASSSFYNNLPLDEDHWYWKVLAYDNEGNVRTSNSTDEFDRIDPRVTSLSWRSGTSSGSGIATSREAGSTVYVRADAVGMNGQTITVGIWEDDSPLSDDFVTNKQITIGSSGYGTTSWRTDWQDDQYGGPEFEIKYSNLKSGLLNVTDTTPPSSFSLQSPDDNATITTSDVDFNWGDSSDSTYGSGFDKYELWVDDNSSFSSPIKKTASSSFYNNLPLDEDHWYWKVLAYDNEGNVRTSNSTDEFDRIDPRVTSLSWRSGTSIDSSIVASRNDGQAVYLRADATGMNGQTITVKIYEEEDIGLDIFDDEITTKSITIGSSGYGTTSWTSQLSPYDNSLPTQTFYIDYDAPSGSTDRESTRMAIVPQSFTIDNIFFSDLNDLDGDGYHSEATVRWDANVNFGDAIVTAKIYADEGTWGYEQHLGDVGPYTIPGNSSGDSRSFAIPTTLLESNVGPTDDYQITIKLYVDGNKVKEEDSGWVKLEPPSKEEQEFYVDNIHFTDTVDADNDEYYGKATVHWDANVSFGSALITAQVWVDETGFLAGTEQRLDSGQFAYTISGDSSADKKSFAIPTEKLAENWGDSDDYNVRIKLFVAGESDPVAVVDSASIKLQPPLLDRDVTSVFWANSSGGPLGLNEVKHGDTVYLEVEALGFDINHIFTANIYDKDVNFIPFFDENDVVPSGQDISISHKSGNIWLSNPWQVVWMEDVWNPLSSEYKNPEYIFSLEDDQFNDCSSTIKIIAEDSRIDSINRWWAYAGEILGDDGDDVILDIYAGAPGKYKLDINIDEWYSIYKDWSVTDDAYVTVDGSTGKEYPFGFDIFEGFDVANGIEIDNVGSHKLYIHGLAAPENDYVVEPIDFKLVAPNGSSDVLKDIMFISDRRGLTNQKVSTFSFMDGFGNMVLNTVNSLQSLIKAYAPVMWFNAGEHYTPVSVDTVLENSNVTLVDKNNNEVDYSYALSDLGSISDPNTYLDLPGSSPAEYRPNGDATVYASVVPDNHDNPNKIAINYSFFYPYSNWKEHDGKNNHEGDWEGITVFLEKDNDFSFNPISVGYAQHIEVLDGFCPGSQDDGGQLVDWSSAASGYSNPSVFVGLGGHASYSNLGFTTWLVPNLSTTQFFDEAHWGDNASMLSPADYEIELLGRTVELSSSSDYSWALYPGHWGKDDNGDNLDGNGPRGPVFQGPEELNIGDELGSRWFDPWAWSSGFDVFDQSPNVINFETTGTPISGYGGMEISFEVLNESSESTLYTDFAVYLSENDHLSGDDPELWSTEFFDGEAMLNLSPGSSFVVSNELAMPANLQLGATYYLFATTKAVEPLSTNITSFESKQIQISDNIELVTTLTPQPGDILFKSGFMPQLVEDILDIAGAYMAHQNDVSLRDVQLGPWRPGHVGIYSHWDPELEKHVVIEALAFGPQINRYSQIEEFAGEDIYMGARSIAGGLNASQKNVVIQAANDAISLLPNYAADAFLGLYAGLGLGHGTLSKGDVGNLYTCVGLSEYAYEHVGENIVSLEQENSWPLALTPHKQFNRTIPSDYIEVADDSVVNFDIYGVYHGNKILSGLGANWDSSIPGTPQFNNGEFSWYVPADTSGDYTFEFTVDHNGVTQTQSIVIGVKDVIKNIPDVSIREDALGAYSIDLWEYAECPETPDSEAVFSIIENTTPGVLVDLDSNRYLRITSEKDWHGSSDITIQVKGEESEDIETFGVEVTSVNDAPSFTTSADVTAIEDSGSYSNQWATDLSAGPTDESSQNLTFDLVENGNSLLFKAGHQPAIDSNGILSFMTEENAFGTATFTVTLQDDGGTANGGEDTYVLTESFTITIDPVNDPPVVNTEPTIIPIDEDHTYNGNVTATDVDGDVLKYDLDQPLNGNVEMNLDGTFTYTPDENYFGDDSFTYWANDGEYDSDPKGIFAFEIQSVNDLPVAVFDYTNYDTENGRVIVAENEVSVPDDQEFIELDLTGTDVETSPELFVAEIVAYPQDGVLEHFSGNRWRYTPDESVNGNDSFSYIVEDTDGGVSEEFVTVLLDIKPWNSKPVADSQVNDENGDNSVKVLEDQSVIITLTGSDIETPTDDLVYDVVQGSGPQNGILIKISNGQYCYEPDENFFGDDSFEFTVTDNGDPAESHLNPGDQISLSATVSIDITPINDPPVAYDMVDGDDNNQYNTVPADDTGEPAFITLAGTDVETPNDLTADIITGPEKGTLELIEGRKYKYVVDEGQTGSDSFTFKLIDPDPEGAVSNTATVEIDIRPVNQKPIAEPQTVTVDEDDEITITLHATDMETTESNLVFSTTNPANGTLTLISGSNNQYRYVPSDDYFGDDSFTFTAKDDGDPAGTYGNGRPGTDDDPQTSDPATVTIVVNPIPDPSIPEDQNIVTEVDSQYSGQVTANDVDGDDLTYHVEDDPEYGIVIVNSDGTFSYTPDDGYYGEDNFTFKANDSVEAGEVSIIVGQITTVYPNKRHSFYDADGDFVTVMFTGTVGSTMEIIRPNDSRSDIARLVLNGTSSSSMLMISTTGGNTNAGDIIVNGSLNFLMARSTELQGNLDLTGSLGIMMIGDIADGVTVTTGLGGNGLMIMAGDVADADFDIAGPVNTFIADSFIDGSIVADSIGLVMPRLGNFGADLTARNGNISTVITTGDISGQLKATTGNINLILSRQGSFSGSAIAGNDIRTVIFNGDIAGQLDAGNNINLILSQREGSSGSVRAGNNIGTFMVNGDISGKVTANQNINMVLARGGDLTGVLRAGEDIGMVWANNLENAILSTGQDIRMVISNADITGSLLLAGFDIGEDCEIDTDEEHLNQTNDDDFNEAGGNIGFLMAGRNAWFNGSFALAGIKPYEKDFSDYKNDPFLIIAPDPDLQIKAYSGKIGSAFLGQVFQGARESGVYGLYAASHIGPVSYTEVGGMNTPDFEIRPPW